MKKKNPVGWFEISVDDMERARKFYEAVFEVNLVRIENPETEEKGLELYAFPSDYSTYGAPGGLIKGEGLQSGGNSTIVYFSCDDCGLEGKKFEKHGGKIHQLKTSIGQYGYISIVSDTEGNMLGLHSQN